ncbi:MAG: hypothetical protein Q4D72_08360 [Capnocytophaga sp.]|nr:hypothetical protein [Capnocytophaga sp.]
MFQNIAKMVTHYHLFLILTATPTADCHSFGFFTANPQESYQTTR